MKQLSNKAIVIGLEKINLNDYPDLKVLGVNCTGLDHLPWEQIKERDIQVISLKDYPTFLKTISSTAEHTIGLIIALMRNYKTALNAPYKDREEYKGHTLNGKTLGIIGYGRIGRQVKHIAEAFGMKVIWVDSEVQQVPHTLFDLLRESDVVSLHIPLNFNENFFTTIMFQAMKPTAYLINTSRDAVIEKGALLWALENKIIAGAGVDFLDSPELLDYSLKNNNLILTNHISGNTFEDRIKTENFIIKMVENYLTDNKL